MGNTEFKVALVTSFPPSRGDLNEYGYHLAASLRHQSNVTLVILADYIEEQVELPGFRVNRCWRFNSLFSFFSLLRAIRRERPNGVWFNIGFSTFANMPITAFLSSAIPLVTRWMGFYTHVTLHTVFERINLHDAGILFPSLYRFAGRLATQIILRSGDVSVLMPSFREGLLRDYKVKNDRVHFFPHGTFASKKEAPELLYRVVDRKPVVLAFGYWGTYKRLELLIECFQEVVRLVPDATLQIVGKDHPNTPGYLAQLQAALSGVQSIQFIGYIAEDEVPRFFERARVIVLPYTSAAGTSGVLHQACQFGLPIIATKIPEFLELAVEENLAIDFYSQGDKEVLSQHLLRILGSKKDFLVRSERNFAAGRSTPIDGVVNSYLRLFRKRTKNKG